MKIVLKKAQMQKVTCLFIFVLHISFFPFQDIFIKHKRMTIYSFYAHYQTGMRIKTALVENKFVGKWKRICCLTYFFQTLYSSNSEKIRKTLRFMYLFPTNDTQILLELRFASCEQNFNSNFSSLLKFSCLGFQDFSHSLS